MHICENLKAEFDQMTQKRKTDSSKTILTQINELKSELVLHKDLRTKWKRRTMRSWGASVNPVTSLQLGQCTKLALFGLDGVLKSGIFLHLPSLARLDPTVRKPNSDLPLRAL